MISIRNATKRYGARVILDRLGFTAADGRVTGLLGPNGAGKTTMLRAIAGLAAIDDGTILIDGIDIAGSGVDVRRRLGMLPDDPGLYARLTAREHLEYAARLHGLRGTNLREAVLRATQIAGTEALAERRTIGFSRGERQKVSLARALVHDPQNIILDEPTNGLDVAANRGLRRTIRRLAHDGRCVIVSSHVMQDIAAVCDDVVVIDGGREIARGSALELQEQTGCASLEEAFLQLIGHGVGLA